MTGASTPRDAWRRPDPGCLNNGRYVGVLSMRLEASLLTFPVMCRLPNTRQSAFEYDYCFLFRPCWDEEVTRVKQIGVPITEDDWVPSGRNFTLRVKIMAPV